jgi:hypothetical protein
MSMSCSSPSWSTSSPPCSSLANALYVNGTGLTPDVTASIVSLSAGALAANVLSVIMLLVETVMFRR